MFKHSLHSKAKETSCVEYGRRDIEEEFENYQCRTEGRIPEWIFGTIYKQAGGSFGQGQNDLDGLAHISSFRLEKGKAYFGSKFMRTMDYINFINTGRRTWSGTHNEPEASSFATKIKSTLNSMLGNDRISKSEAKYNDFNPNVTIWLLDNGKQIAAQTEIGGDICEFDAKSLKTLSTIKTMKPMHSNGFLITTPAHYLREGSFGGYHAALEMKISLTIGYPQFTLYYNVYRGDKSPFDCVFQHEVISLKYNTKEKTNKEFSLRPSYMHSIARTENFVILVCSSMKFDLEKLLRRDFSGGFFALVPLVDYPIEFMILRKKKGSEQLELVKKLKSDVIAMLWHVGNCFEVEKDGEKKIVIEAGCSGKFGSDPNFYGRFVLDLNEDSVDFLNLLPNEKETCGYISSEFPVINPNYLMKSNEFSYIVKDPFESTSTLMKTKASRDNNSSSCEVVQEWFNEDGVVPSEPCFVPNPRGNSEDDGVILNMVTDATSEESYLAVIDAMSGNILAKAYSPGPINTGLHSIYVPHGDVSLYTCKL